MLHQSHQVQACRTTLKYRIGKQNACVTYTKCAMHVVTRIPHSFPPAVTVEFDPTSYTVSESGRFANITVVKRGQSALAVSVDFTTADGTAIGES